MMLAWPAEPGWFALEWTGTIMALCGSWVISSRRWDPVVAYRLWIVSRLLYVALFAGHTHQWDMLTMQVAGVAVEIMGLRQWLRREDEVDKLVRWTLSVLAVAAMAAAILALLALVLGLGAEVLALEWAGSALGMSGTFLLASRGRWARWAFPVWASSNALLAVLTWRSGQMGVLTLQLGFLVLNSYACLSWLGAKEKA